MIAKLRGLQGQSIDLEDWSERPFDYYPDPVVIVAGPHRGERYRFSASKEELVKFATDILNWADK